MELSIERKEGAKRLGKFWEEEGSELVKVEGKQGKEGVERQKEREEWANELLRRQDDKWEEII